MNKIKDYSLILDNFTQPKFMADFFWRHRKKFSLRAYPQYLEIKIFHKYFHNYNEEKNPCFQSIRLIAIYSFLDGTRKKEITGKIRIFLNNDLAFKFWRVAKFLARQRINFTPRPYHYFPQYHIFFYQAVPGLSLGEMVSQHLVSEKEFLSYIELATKKLAQLHKLKVKSQDLGRNFYTLRRQLNSYAGTLAKFQGTAVEDALALIKNFQTKQKKYCIIKEKRFVHGDFQIENFLFRQKNFYLIDFDHAEAGDPLIDVGNFLVQIYYGGHIPCQTLKAREFFLEKYLAINTSLEKKFFNERLNLFIAAANIKNISSNLIYFFQQRKQANFNWELIAKDIKRARYRLENLSSDPIELFTKISSYVN